MCHIIAFVMTGIINATDVILFGCVLLVLLSLPLGSAAQFFKPPSGPGIATFTAHKGLCVGPFQGFSANSFGSIVGGVEILIDLSAGLPLSTRLGRYFPPGKSDQSAVNAWEAKHSL